MSFTLVHLFPLQSLESHVTKKAHPSQHQLLLLFCLGLSMQDLVTIWILRIQRTCLNSLLRCCCCILERELLLLSNKNFPGCSHLFGKTSMKFGTHRFRRVPPFFPEHLPLIAAGPSKSSSVFNSAHQCNCKVNLWWPRKLLTFSNEEQKMLNTVHWPQPAVNTQYLNNTMAWPLPVM